MLQVFCIARLLQETFIDNTGGGVPTLILKLKNPLKTHINFLKANLYLSQTSIGKQSAIQEACIGLHIIL